MTVPAPFLIDLDGEALTAAISGAILHQLSGDRRDDLIRQAIAFLITPQRAYGNASAKSPLQDVIETVARQTAFEVVREHVAADPAFREQIRAGVVEATAKLLCDNKLMADALAQALAQALERKTEWE